MKKISIISAALLTVASTASAEVVHNTYFEEDFIEMGHKQNYLEGNGWITYGIDAEPSKTKDLYAYYKDGPNGQYHNFFLLEYNNQCYPLSCTNFDPPQPADQWMVTPEFEITDENAILSFTAACYSIQDWGTASNPIEVRISTTGTEKEDFENVVYSGSISATASTLGSVRVVNIATRINDYKGKKVRLAFVNRGQDGGNVGFTNISVGNYAFIAQDNTPRTAVNGDNVEVVVNIGLKAPVTCPGINVTLEFEDQKFEKTFTKAFGTTSNSIVYQLCRFSESPIKITDHSVSYKLTVVPQFEGATPSYINGTITVPELYYPNNVVVEEATASGCGYCPRGTASLQYYSHTYTGENGTGRAIPVAIHGNMNYTDPMNAGVESYIQSLYTLNGTTGLPQAIFNRSTRGKDPAAATFFMNEYKKAALYKAEIKGVTVPANAKWGDKVTVDYEVRSGFTATGVPVLVAAILTEDNVIGNDGGYTQENYFYNMNEAQAVAQLQQLGAGEYAADIATYLRPYLQGGDLGTSTVAFSKMVYNHVARTIAPSFQGQSFGGEWTADQPVAGQISFEIPDNVTGYINGGEAVNIDNLNVVLIIMDPNDNYAIIASDEAALNGTSLGVSGIADDAAAVKGVYNLQGIKLLDNADEAEVNALPAGIYIINGKKTVIR